MTRHLLAMVGCALAASAWAAPNVVTVHEDEAGFQLHFDGEPYLVKGQNWTFYPIGTNYSYSLWQQDDEFIETALHREMTLLKAGGTNSIRQYANIPPRWVEWIYDNYGITTMVNPLVGRYGVNVNGRWVPETDYSDPATREAIRAETLAAIERHKDTRGVVFWLLGNENNYGLSWSGFEIQNLPEGERHAAKAKYLYSLFGELVDEIHAMDPNHPVAICNGDAQYLDLIKQEVPNLDIFGTNVYRGHTVRDMWQTVDDTLGIPVVFTEFGADAYDAKAGREDHITQARYVGSQWEDIYLNVHGRGVGNSLGGYVFQWTDGWWKYKQEENLDVHDTNASWATGAYAEDYVEGANNMNEEWWGITAKGPVDADGHFDLFPRASYYVLRDAWELDPYAPEVTDDDIRAHFAALEPAVYDQAYKASLATGQVDKLSRAYLSNVRVEVSTFATTSDRARGEGKQRFAFDHLESFYVETEAHPSDAFRAELAVNALGNVPTNRIDKIFYESRGRDLVGSDLDGAELDLSGLERVKIYGSSFNWEHDLFTLEGFYRRPHFHWGYEGDFFGLYREANYGPNLDIYNGDAPIGVELTGKRKLGGLRVAFGPQLFWGANPAVFGMYTKQVKGVKLALIHQEDLAAQGVVNTTFAVPEQVTRKTALSAEFKLGPANVEMGGIMAGTDRVGESFTRVVEATGDESYESSGYHVLTDEIALADTLGGRARIDIPLGKLRFLADGSYKGLVSDGGVDGTQTFTGWTLRQSQRGNQMGANAGLGISLGSLQVAPNVLWQKPLVGPNPNIADRWEGDAGWYYPGVTPRNILDDPFAVLENRETTGFELLLAYDTTPGTWMWSWDNEMREDAPFAASLDITYRIQPTSRDSNFGFLEDGTLYSFNAAPPAQDVWDARAKAILNPRGDLKLILGAYTGTAQAKGSDERLITRGGGEVKIRHKTLAWDNWVKVNDWGPYDYHQDYNNTYPLQLTTDLSGGLSAPRMGVVSTRIGAAAKYRTLDQYSESFVPRAGDPDALGYEFEIGTYIFVSL